MSHAGGREAKFNEPARGFDDGRSRSVDRMARLQTDDRPYQGLVRDRDSSNRYEGLQPSEITLQSDGLHTYDRPYQGLVRDGNQADRSHQYEGLQLSDITFQGARGGQSSDIKERKTNCSSNSSQLKDIPGSGIKYLDNGGSVYNTIHEATSDVKCITHQNRRRCLIVITILVVAVLVAGSIAAGIFLSTNKEDTQKPNASRLASDCGQYTDSLVNLKYTLSNGPTTFNSSLAVTCNPGLSHADGSASAVRCGANGSWEGTPNCIIIGRVEFSEPGYDLTIGKDGGLSCNVSQYPDWQHVRIIRGSNEAEVAVYDITNKNGDVQSSSYLADTNYTLQNDGLIINVNFNPVTCSNEGTYYCLLIVGDKVEVKVANTFIRLRAESSRPQLVVPEQLLVTRAFVVTCSGNVGRTNSGSYGQITLDNRANGVGDFTTVSGVNNTKCDGNVQLTVNLTADRYYRDREFRCKIEDPIGIILYSEVVNRTVIDSFGANITGYRIFSNGLPGDGLLEVNIPGFCDWAPVRYNARFNYHDPLDVLICQHLGYRNESIIPPTSNTSSYPDACMTIKSCPTSNLTTIYDIANQCDVEYGPAPWYYGVIYKEINCVPAQLVNGNSTRHGRVEAGLFGKLQSICSLGFDARAANVICASLGYKRVATQLWRQSQFGAGSVAIYKRNITCSGYELSLELCSHSSTDIPGCDSSNVVGVECLGDTIKLEPLYESRSYEGILEGYHGDFRYDILGDVSTNTAQTLCAMLGYGHVGFAGQAIPTRNVKYYKKYVSCSGTEKSISDCEGDLEYCVTQVDERCKGVSNMYKHVALFCADYKMQGLSIGSDGKLLMKINGRQWASCIDYVSKSTAEAACRIMGYSGSASIAEQQSGTNDTEIIGSLVCNVNATSVEDCQLKHQFTYRPYLVNAACTQLVLLTCGSSNTIR